MEDIQKNDSDILKDNIATIFSGLCRMFDEYGQIRNVVFTIKRPMDLFTIKKHPRETATVFRTSKINGEIFADFMFEGEEVYVPYCKNVDLEKLKSDEFKKAFMSGLIPNSTYDVCVAIRRNPDNPERFDVAIGAINNLR